jgi:signal transduction histidine kinase
MTSIRSFSDILLTTPDLDEAQRQRFLRIIQNESLRLTRLLDRILEMSPADPAETPQDAGVDFDPETALDQAMESCEALARAAGVTLQRPARARNARLRGDADRLAQVFINLISNAIKYNTSRDPVVVVTSAVCTDLYEVRVLDNGPGIPIDDRERIFAKFARGSSSRQSGAGLGLAISRQIVTGFERGSLSLEQSELGGAQFVVRAGLSS